MSYVLEALKRAEAEKDPGARIALVQERRDYRRNRWWQILVATALLANVAVLLWLFYPRHESGGGPVDQAETQQPLTADPPPPPSAATAPDATNAALADDSTAPSEIQVEPPADTPVIIGDGAAGTTATPVRLRLSDLPSDARGRFPGLAFSTHIYAEDPALRALVVNGNRLAEGDRFGVLELVEVTEEGAVFGFENYLVEMAVLETWD